MSARGPFRLFFNLPEDIGWHQHWLAESIRLQESDSGRFDDSLANTKVRAQSLPLQQALVERAKLLALDLGIAKTQQQWLRWWRGLLKVGFIIAFIVGLLAAVGYLNESNAPVNLLWALIILLGPNMLALMLWLVMFRQAKRQGAGSGSLLMDVAEKISGKNSVAPLAPGLLSFMQRQKVTAWLFSSITHLFWLCLMLGIWLGTLSMLLAQDYSFYWGSTLLTSDQVAPAIVALGEPATWLGLPMPNTELIHQTGEQAQSGTEVRYQWGAWLLWTLFLVGVLPRLLLLLLSQYWVWRRHVPQELPMDPAWLPLQKALAAPISKITDERGAGAASVTTPTTIMGNRDGSNICVPFELDPRTDYSLDLEPSVKQWPMVNGRTQQQQLIEHLANSSNGANRALLVCDPRTTPDRGLRRFITELASVSAEVGVIFVPTLTGDALAKQQQTWHEQLQDLNVQWPSSPHWLA